jgi:hypothetical protein
MSRAKALILEEYLHFQVTLMSRKEEGTSGTGHSLCPPMVPFTAGSWQTWDLSSPGGSRGPWRRSSRIWAGGHP